MSAILNRPLFRQGGGGAELPRAAEHEPMGLGGAWDRTKDIFGMGPELIGNLATGSDEWPVAQRLGLIPSEDVDSYHEIDEQARIEATLEGLLPSQKEFVTDLLARGMSLDYAIHQLRTKIIFERHRIENEESRAGLLPDPPPYVPPTEAEMLERVGPQARAMMEHEGYPADLAVPYVQRSIRDFGEERPYSVPETPSEGRLRQPSRFQGGGPVMPQQAMMAPPPQAMMAPPPQGAGLDALMAQAPQALGAGGGQTAAEMEKMGSQYVNEMMSAVDAAENPEDLINAIRGTDVPIGDRYTELAQIVGPDDAQSTPESVLVLVQPTLMMTEQGALDSGVGNLMQGMASDTEMATDTGIPTPMGEGIGNLMMAGAPPPDMMMAGAPPPDMMMARRGGPVQNFWGGGPVVQKFADGDEVSSFFSEYLKKKPERKSIAESYKEYIDPVQSILGRTQKEEEYSQALLLADIAERAFAFGAGVSPDTGKSITHLSTAAQLGAVSKTLPKALVASAGEEAAQTREIKKFALAAGISEREAAFKRSQALELEALKTDAALRAAELKRRLDREDKPANLVEMYVDGEHVATLDELDHKKLIQDFGKIPRSGIRFHTLSTAKDVEEARLLKASGMVDLFDNQGTHVDTLNLNSPGAFETLAAHREAGGTIRKIGTTPAPSVVRKISNVALLDEYAAGNPLDTPSMITFIANVQDYLTPRLQPDGSTALNEPAGPHLAAMAKRIVKVEPALISPETDENRTKRRAQILGLAFKTYNNIANTLAPYIENEKKRSLGLGQAFKPGELADIIDQPFEEGGEVQKFQDGNEVEKLYPPGQIRHAELATGKWSGVRRGIFNITAGIKELFALDDFKPFYMDTMKASKDMNTLAQMTKRFFQSSVAGREAAQQLLEMEQYDLARPSMWTSDEAALETLKNTRGILEAHKDSLNMVVNAPDFPVSGEDYKWRPETRDKAKMQMPILEDLLGAYDRAISGYKIQVRDIQMVTTPEEEVNIPSGEMYRKFDPDTGRIRPFVK